MLAAGDTGTIRARAFELVDERGHVRAQLNVESNGMVVVYAGASGLVLPPTPGDCKGEIRAALDALRAGGSTAGGAGIQLPYEVAQDGFIEGGPPSTRSCPRACGSTPAPSIP